MHSVTPNESVTYGVLHQDEHVLVVHKRAGLVTQPGKGHEEDSLLNGLFARFGKQLQALGAKRDYGLVHRLDRETSGIVAVALTADAYDGLREQFEERLVRKFYWAICEKAPREPAGLIEKPLMETDPSRGRPSRGEKKLAKISAKGKPSATAYRVVAVTSAPGGIGALIEARPLTGRLHQIRVHLDSIGCPILGDGLYAPERVGALSPRLALHAHRLAFAHPITGEPVDCRSEFPKDLRPVLTRMKLPRPDGMGGGKSGDAGAAE